MSAAGPAPVAAPAAPAPSARPRAVRPVPFDELAAVIATADDQPARMIGPPSPRSPASPCGRPTSGPATCSPRCPAPARTAPTSPPRPRPRRRRRPHRPRRRPPPRRPEPRRSRCSSTPDPAAVLGGRGRARLRRPHRPTSRVIGITGTSGKTTIALPRRGGPRRGRAHAPGCSAPCGIRIDGRPLPSAFTTPEAPDLQALFARDARARASPTWSMEVSSHALALGRVAGTALRGRRVHQPLPGPPGLPPRHGRVLRGQGHAVRRARRARGRLRRRHLGRRGSPPARRTPSPWPPPGAPPTGAPPTSAPTPTAASTSRALTPDGPVPVRLRLPGRVQRGQRAARARAAWPRSACPRPSPRSGSPRSRCPAGCSGSTWASRSSRVVDYAHKPAAVAALLDTLRAQVPGTADHRAGLRRRPRPRQAPAHGRRSRAAQRRAGGHRRQPALRAPGRHPRRDARRAPSTSPATVSCTRSATGARRSSPRSTRPGPGDAVVVAGKGHETGQEVAGVRHPFDDAVELAAAIRGVITGVLGAARR